jgi:O-antigen/teichoic acid export membrane protein
MSLTYKRFLSRAVVGSASLLDQFFFAGSTFAINILLARWLEPKEYGAFVFVYSLFLLIIAIHSSIFTEPMLILGSNKSKLAIKKYFGVLLKYQCYMSIIIFLLFSIISFLTYYFSHAQLGKAFLGIAIAGPMILFLWLFRRFNYARFIPWLATLSSFIFFSLLMTGFFALKFTNRFSLLYSFVILAGSAAIASFISLFWCKPQFRDIKLHTYTYTALAHWNYGKWSLSTIGLIWISSNIYTFVLPIWCGFEGVAAMRAVVNLGLPVLHSLMALSQVLIPTFSRKSKNDDVKTIVSITIYCLSILFCSIAIYTLLLLMFRTEMLNLIYDGKYTQYDHLVLFIGPLLFFGGIVSVLENTLKATKRIKYVFMSYLWRTTIAIVIGIPLVAFWSISGAMLSMVLSYAVTAIAVYYYFRLFIKNSKKTTYR